jgi:hypothetical protein
LLQCSRVVVLVLQVRVLIPPLVQVVRRRCQVPILPLVLVPLPLPWLVVRRLQ